MPFTFDSPISSSSAYKKTHRRKSAPSTLPSSKPKSSSLFGKLTHRIQNSDSGSSAPSSKAQPTPAADSLFFRLPLPLRQQIYGYVIAQSEVLHILLKHKPSSQSSGYGIAYRRCRAGSSQDDCIASRCKEFLNVADGSYFGSFDHVGGLFLACRDIYKEAITVLYTQNTFDFDHPQSFLLFSSQISLDALQSIRSIAFEPQRQLYVQKATSRSSQARDKAFQQGYWVQMWSTIAQMQGLDELRVRFRSPLLGWNDEDLLDPLFGVRIPLKVFEVEAPWISSVIDITGMNMPFKLLGTD